MSAIVIGVVAVAAIVVAYFERKSIKAEADKVKAAAETKVATFEQALRVKESQVRATIAKDIAAVVAKVKADATQAEQTVIAKAEAEIKKVV